MKNYLVAISIGPVQDFIIAARRTRDLWQGSYILSEISKAGAKALYEEEAALIFPHTEEVDLENPRFNVGNKLLAKVSYENSDALESGLKQVKKAIQNRFEVFSKVAKEKVKRTGISLNETIWDMQIKDAIEIYCAWTEVTQENYNRQKHKLDGLLAARKNTREFNANPVDGFGIPKSALDGLRETVITAGSIKAYFDCGLNAQEKLDSTGLIKRISQDVDQFTPLSRLAIDPWVREITENDVAKQQLDQINDYFNDLAALQISSRVHGNNEHYKAMPYDGQLIYPFREQAEIDRARRSTDRIDKKIATITNLWNKSPLTQLIKKYGEPSPYMAILVADGDHMGKLLTSLDQLQDHQAVSKGLSCFAQAVPEAVRQLHGHCVYAGGDDVLALLPLDTAIDTAAALRRLFEDTMLDVDCINQNNVPTLSVGVGISHFLTPMPRQLDLARQAEQLAKGDHLEGVSGQSARNALAILFQPRSGAISEFRESWSQRPEKTLSNYINAIDSGALPSRVGYQLREQAHALSWVESYISQYLDLLEKEMQRIMQKKRDTKQQALDQNIITAISQRAREKGLSHVAKELILARRFARHQPSQEQSGDEQ